SGVRLSLNSRLSRANIFGFVCCGSVFAVTRRHLNESTACQPPIGDQHYETTRESLQTHATHGMSGGNSSNNRSFLRYFAPLELSRRPPWIIARHHADARRFEPGYSRDSCRACSNCT